MPVQTLDALDDYRCADRLLPQGRAAEVLRSQPRVEPPVGQASVADHLAAASFHVCRGRALASRAPDAGTPAADARRHLDAAVDHLRQTGHAPALPAGLIARADFAIEHGDLKAVEKDLTEALAIAQRHELRQCETEAMLGFARLSLAAAVAPAVREQCLIAAMACWQHAAKLIREASDERRLAEASLIEAEVSIATNQSEAALAALTAACEAISDQQHFSLMARLNRLAAGFPSLGPTLAHLADERIAFDKVADAQGHVPNAQDETVDKKEDETGAAYGGPGLAVQVATVLADPDLRRKTADMLANPEARAALIQYMSDMAVGSLDDLEPEQQLGAMAAFILSRNDDDDEDDRDDDEDATGTSNDDASDVPVSGQLAAAVEALLGDAQGREMVDGLLLHPGFRQALITELEDSKVPVPLEQLPRDIQRKFAAAFALEKGVISVGRGDEPES